MKPVQKSFIDPVWDSPLVAKDLNSRKASFIIEFRGSSVSDKANLNPVTAKVLIEGHFAVEHANLSPSLKRDSSGKEKN